MKLEKCFIPDLGFVSSFRFLALMRSDLDSIVCPEMSCETGKELHLGSVFWSFSFVFGIHERRFRFHSFVCSEIPMKLGKCFIPDPGFGPFFRFWCS